MPAQAQTADSAGATKVSQPDEIIVTALRREQNLQDVSVAVSTVGAEQLEARRLSSVDQLSGIAPNLSIVSSPITTSGSPR
ncbi:MAG: hypothetical protein PHE36_10250 [Novosphingobium sp.]|nr:hypothetical protein [Novosphingobium sp.]